MPGNGPSLAKFDGDFVKRAVAGRSLFVEQDAFG